MVIIFREGHNRRHQRKGVGQTGQRNRKGVSDEFMSEIKSIYKQMFQSLTGAALGLLTVVSDRLRLRFTDLWSDTDGKSKSYFFLVQGGGSSGSCASGFGVCCTFSLACGGTAAVRGDIKSDSFTWHWQQKIKTIPPNPPHAMQLLWSDCHFFLRFFFGGGRGLESSVIKNS